jgi:AraC-like DNA-binding protein
MMITCHRAIRRNKIFFLPAALLLLAVTISCGANRSAPEVRGWEILLSQDESPESAMRSTGWKKIPAPFLKDSPYPPVHDFQHFWLRGTFTVDDPARYHGVSLGRMALTDSTYLNGHPVGSLGRNMACFLPKPRHYAILTDAGSGPLRRGDNSICIRVGYYGNEEAGLLDTARLMDENEFEISRLRGALLFEQLPAGIMTVFALAIGALIVLYLVSFREPQMIFNGMALLMLLVHGAAILTPFRFIHPDASIIIQRALVPVFFTICIFMIQSTYRVYLTKYNMIAVPLFAVYATVIAAASDTLSSIDIGSAMEVVSVVTMVVFSAFMLPRLRALHRERFTFYMILIFIVIITITACLEILFNVISSRYKDLLLTYFVPAVIPLFTLILIRDFLKRKKELDILYGRLRTFEERGRNVSITDTAQAKLQKLVEFINENYLSDISREGLASAVDMSPNYTSRLFREYTGMKINDYINRLRVEYAARKLREEDSRIIDIALSAGFESLTTFNRTFKEIIGRTPTRYREEER